MIAFVAAGEVRFVRYRRAYELGTDQLIVAPSSFYNLFTEAIAGLLRDLLDHAVKEVAVPHTVAPTLRRFRDLIAADATVVVFTPVSLSLSSDLPNDALCLKLFLIHNVLGRLAISDERTHKSALSKTGSWLRGRLILLDLGFFKYRRSS